VATALVEDRLSLMGLRSLGWGVGDLCRTLRNLGSQRPKKTMPLRSRWRIRDGKLSRPRVGEALRDLDLELHNILEGMGPVSGGPWCLGEKVEGDGSWCD